jgi:hypothetical protein
MTQALQKIANSEIVLYQKYDGKRSDLATVLETPLSELRLENRLITDDGMFIGGLYDLVLSEKTLNGKAYLVSYALKKELDKEQPSMQQSFWNKLFGDKPLLEGPTVIHEGKKYSREWKIYAGGQFAGHCIVTDWDKPTLRYYLLDELRADALNYHNTVIGESLMKMLFAESFKAVLLAYDQLMHAR